MPVELQAQGYALSAAGEGERIVATSSTEQFCMGADGVQEPLTTGSTRPVALTVTHAGICKVQRWAFSLTERELFHSRDAKLPNRVPIPS